MVTIEYRDSYGGFLGISMILQLIILESLNWFI